MTYETYTAIACSSLVNHKRNETRTYHYLSALTLKASSRKGIEFKETSVNCKLIFLKIDPGVECPKMSTPKSTKNGKFDVIQKINCLHIVFVYFDLLISQSVFVCINL